MDLVLEKIDSDYECWANLNPTLIMRKNIDQIVAYTQGTEGVHK
jgi:hypothetical protein